MAFSCNDVLITNQSSVSVSIYGVYCCFISSCNHVLFLSLSLFIINLQKIIINVLNKFKTGSRMLVHRSIQSNRHATESYRFLKISDSMGIIGSLCRLVLDLIDRTSSSEPDLKTSINIKQN